MPTFEELYKEAKLLAQRKKDREETLKKEREEKEMEGVTFKPKISLKPVEGAKQSEVTVLKESKSSKSKLSKVGAGYSEIMMVNKKGKRD